MTAIASPGQRIGSSWPVRRWPLLAAALLAASATLQLLASLQRWVAIGGAWNRTDISVEDHRFDYSYPSDPWENLGSAAELFGVGMLLAAAGIVAMAVPRRDPMLVRLLVGAVAAITGLTGAHALLSGILGFPSPLQHLLLGGMLGFVAFAGLVILAALWSRASRATSLACVLLLATTPVGYILSAFVIAPLLLDYRSHDTTPWTETIVAAAVGFAATAMIVAAAFPLRRADAQMVATRPASTR